MKIYLDSDVYLAYFKSEKQANRDIWTEQIFREILTNKNIQLIFSYLTVLEISKILGEPENAVRALILLHCPAACEIAVTREIRNKSKEFEKIGVHFPDSMHAAFAFYESAGFVTFNVKDYQNISGLKVIEPRFFFSV